ncbi:MAG: hypothetical protein EB084_02465 [Proteobacteria bacterium]|nr:hypothetical protein [Pseudomonadota bacterium]
MSTPHPSTEPTGPASEPEHVHGPGCNHHHAPQVPYVRDTPKVGRNDACPCGSGKKHKKCCGA